jgi:hypothetical protein
MALPLGGLISHETTFVVVADKNGKLRVVLSRIAKRTRVRTTPSVAAMARTGSNRIPSS